MPFISGVDTLKTNILGNGSPVSQYEAKYYVNTAETSVSDWNPESNASCLRLIGVEKFDANAPASQIKFYDGFDQRGVKRGRLEATLEITQEDYGIKESIKRFENKDAFWIEAIGDDRDLYNADGTFKFQYLSVYYGKLVEYSADKSELYKVTGKGSYDTSKTRTIYKGITPCKVTATGAGSVASGGTKTFSVTAKDFYNADVTLDSTNAEVTKAQFVVTSATGTGAIGGTQTWTATGITGTLSGTTFSGASTNTITGVVRVFTQFGGYFDSAPLTVTIS